MFSAWFDVEVTVIRTPARATLVEPIGFDAPDARGPPR
ncbi:hypothetical protein FHX52_0601 [Humibacillus xanthopallidus]|uniref:Uncharacterized protein n=1 Tax=Humibacillus xanthopallidus TaxID=412689 RepID=A0A543PTV4_9MICO|nr:hypothetical protein FHX52_0601 [Humibacillus xanthopallidus]